MQPGTHLFSYWRVGVAGSSNSLPAAAAEMCDAVGARLAQAPNVKIVHHGLKLRFAHQPDNLAADWYYIEGARRTLGPHDESRLETLIAQEPAAAAVNSSKAQSDDGQPVMFTAGDIRRIRANTFQARRFSFVGSLDALIGIRGGYGTFQQLVLASAIGLPVLPIPCFGGRTRVFWEENRADVMASLDIDEPTAERWEQPPQTGAEIETRAAEMVDALVGRLPKRAFIIMPYAPEFDTLYDLIIAPAVTANGDEIRRLDRLNTPGSLIPQILDGITTADYCVVVLDGFRPNVLYEMGYAQALGKPLILIMHAGTITDASDVPFDISTLQRIEYERPDQGTLNRLTAAVHNVIPRRYAQRSLRS